MNLHGQVGVYSPSGRPARLVRSIAAALACVTTAAIGHMSAGGQLSAGGVLAVFLGGVSITWLLSSRRVTAGQILGLLVLCQVAVHLAPSAAPMTMDASMLLAHVAATALSALALARGEQFAWQLADRLGLRTVRLLHMTALFVGLRLPAPLLVVRTLRDCCLTYSRALRGPPIGIA